MWVGFVKHVAKLVKHLRGERTPQSSRVLLSQPFCILPLVNGSICGRIHHIHWIARIRLTLRNNLFGLRRLSLRECALIHCPI